MARWIVAGLFVLNVVLGVGVYLRLGERTARAQIGTPPALYAVAGNSNNMSVVYILDANTGMLLALNTDVVNRQVKVIDQRNAGEDLSRIRVP